MELRSAIDVLRSALAAPYPIPNLRNRRRRWQRQARRRKLHLVAARQAVEPYKSTVAHEVGKGDGLEWFGLGSSAHRMGRRPKSRTVSKNHVKFFEDQNGDRTRSPKRGCPGVAMALCVCGASPNEWTRRTMVNYKVGLDHQQATRSRHPMHRRQSDEAYRTICGPSRRPLGSWRRPALHRRRRGTGEWSVFEDGA